MTPNAIEASTVDEYLRTFSGVEGVLGALGVYRAAFTTIEQTTPLTKAKLSVQVVAIGGERGLDDKVKQGIQLVAERVTGETIPDCGHFVPEEAPRQLVRSILNTLQLPRT